MRLPRHCEDDDPRSASLVISRTACRDSPPPPTARAARARPGGTCCTSHGNATPAARTRSVPAVASPIRRRSPALSGHVRSGRPAGTPGPAASSGSSRRDHRVSGRRVRPCPAAATVIEDRPSPHAAEAPSPAWLLRVAYLPGHDSRRAVPISQPRSAWPTGTRHVAGLSQTGRCEPRVREPRRRSRPGAARSETGGGGLRPCSGVPSLRQIQPRPPPRLPLDLPRPHPAPADSNKGWHDPASAVPETASRRTRPGCNWCDAQHAGAESVAEPTVPGPRQG